MTILKRNPLSIDVNKPWKAAFYNAVPLEVKLDKSGTLDITGNGYFDVMSYRYASVSVNNDYSYFVLPIIRGEVTEFIDPGISNSTSFGSYAWNFAGSSVDYYNQTAIQPILTKLVVSKFWGAGSSAFINQGHLSYVFLSNRGTNAYIGSYAFAVCGALSKFILSGNTVITLSSSTAFNNTPLSTTGNIYVPSSLVSAYQNATNWITFSSRIVSHENLSEADKYDWF